MTDLRDCPLNSSATRIANRPLILALLGLLNLCSAGFGVPVVTTENFNELGSAYQQAVSSNALTGLPAGISATFAGNCQLIWSPGFNPPGSAATNNIEVGWTPASPAVTFNKPVVLWSLQALKKWSNNVSIVGKRNGVQVWAYTNSDPTANTWFLVTRGAGKIIDQLDIDSDWWGAKFTDLRLSDAAGLKPFTNTSPFYVDGTNSLASDYNPGTAALPWKTLQWAASTLQPGDTVYIKAATYTGDLVPVNSGAPNAWITYSAFPGQEQQAVIDHAGVNIYRKTYIKISGLKVQYPGSGTGGAGISVVGPGGNYIISGNYTYDTYSSGIGVWGVPWQSDPGIYDYKAITNVLIENNTIEKACDGGWNEQLDIANGVDNFEIRNNVLKHGTNAFNGGEGIDCKEGASNGKIWGNEIYDIRRYAVYLEAGASDPAYYKIRPGVLTNIELYNNLIHNNDAHGIGITSEGRGNIDGMKVYNNLCYSNGSDGILLYHYPSTVNYARNITIINNTTFNNNVNTNAPWYGGIATDHDTAQNIIVRNNISYETLHGAFSIKQPWNPATVLDHNLGTASNPGFVNIAKADFHLRSNSTAVNTGSATGAPLFDLDGSARPYGGTFDLGAFEYIPSTPFTLQIQLARGQSNANLVLQGGPESHYRIEWKSALTNATWTPLQNIPSLPYCPYTVTDTNTPGTARYYRAVLLTP